MDRADLYGGLAGPGHDQQGGQVYLALGFRGVTGFTINDYLNVNRIKKAHRLLLETDDSITSIAEQLGYENITYFERVFKKYRNMTPLKYRNYYRSETE